MHNTTTPRWTGNSSTLLWHWKNFGQCYSVQKYTFTLTTRTSSTLVTPLSIVFIGFLMWMNMAWHYIKLRLCKCCCWYIFAAGTEWYPGFTHRGEGRTTFSHLEMYTRKWRRCSSGKFLFTGRQSWDATMLHMFTHWGMLPQSSRWPGHRQPIGYREYQRKVGCRQCTPTTCCKILRLVDDVLCYVKPGDPPNNWKIALPKELLQPTIQWFHQVTGHLGSKRLYMHINSRYYHRDLRSLIDKFRCEHCQCNKLSSKGYGLLPEQEIHSIPFKEWAVDLIGSLDHGLFRSTINPMSSMLSR